MKDMHETQRAEQLHHDDDKVFSPTEALQRITGGVWNRKSFRLDSQPKGVRWIGYVIAGFVFIMVAIAILNFFNE
jgi:heme A synthase